MLRSRVTWLEYLQSLKPAEHVEGEACQVEHEAGHQDCVQGGEDPAHQVQAGGGGQTFKVSGDRDMREDKCKDGKNTDGLRHLLRNQPPCSSLHSADSSVPKGIFSVALKCNFRCFCLGELSPSSKQLKFSFG